MQIRVESSITLNVGNHYMKELRAADIDAKDAIRLLASDADLSERYEDAGDDPELTHEMLMDAFDSLFFAVKEGLWAGISSQLDELEEL